MKFITFDELNQQGLVENAVLEYFGTMYELASNFVVEGEELLNYPGYQDREWAEALFRAVAEQGGFRRPDMPIAKAPPFSAIQPLITNELVAIFCLADDILEATFYEFLLLYYQRRLLNIPDASHEIRQAIKRLRKARQAFSDQKRAYLQIAYRKQNPHKIRHKLDAQSYSKRSASQKDYIITLQIMPAVFAVIARNESVDLSPLSKLYRKHLQLFAFCDEVITSLSV